MRNRKGRKNKDVENRAFVFRLYPTDEQMILLAKSFGCARKIYTLMLSDKKEHYKTTGKMLTVTPARYKDDYPYLREVDSLTLANEQMNLEYAYKNFFSRKDVGEPKFKAKHRDKDSYTTNLVNENIEIGDSWINLSNIGRIPARIHRTPPEKFHIKSVTGTNDRDGTYQASVLYEYVYNATPVVPSSEMSHVGLDYKLDGLFVASDGTYADMQYFFQEAEKRL